MKYFIGIRTLLDFNYLYAVDKKESLVIETIDNSTAKIFRLGRFVVFLNNYKLDDADTVKTMVRKTVDDALQTRQYKVSHACDYVFDSSISEIDKAYNSEEDPVKLLEAIFTHGYFFGQIFSNLPAQEWVDFFITLSAHKVYYIQSAINLVANLEDLFNIYFFDKTKIFIDFCENVLGKEKINALYAPNLDKLNEMLSQKLTTADDKKAFYNLLNDATRDAFAKYLTYGGNYGEAQKNLFHELKTSPFQAQNPHHAVFQLMQAFDEMLAVYKRKRTDANRMLPSIHGTDMQQFHDKQQEAFEHLRRYHVDDTQRQVHMQTAENTTWEMMVTLCENFIEQQIGRSANDFIDYVNNDPNNHHFKRMLAILVYRCFVSNVFAAYEDKLKQFQHLKYIAAKILYLPTYQFETLVDPKIYAITTKEELFAKLREDNLFGYMLITDLGANIKNIFNLPNNILELLPHVSKTERPDIFRHLISLYAEPIPEINYDNFKHYNYMLDKWLVETFKSHQLLAVIRDLFQNATNIKEFCNQFPLASVAAAKGIPREAPENGIHLEVAQPLIDNEFDTKNLQLLKHPAYDIAHSVIGIMEYYRQSSLGKENITQLEKLTDEVMEKLQVTVNAREKTLNIIGCIEKAFLERFKKWRAATTVRSLYFYKSVDEDILSNYLPKYLNTNIHLDSSLRLLANMLRVKVYEKHADYLRENHIYSDIAGKVKLINVIYYQQGELIKLPERQDRLERLPTY